MVDLPQDERSKARRLARAIASDISMYNEEKIVKGLEQDNFFEALKEEIEDGRELFRSRVSAEIYQKRTLFDRAIVDIIIKPKGHVRSRIW